MKNEYYKKPYFALYTEEYHILVVIGLVLAEFVAPEKNPVDFLAKFLSSWSMVGNEKESSIQKSLL